MIGAMILSQTAEYAFRAMAALAGLAPGEAITAVDLADRTGIPVHYLSKIMRRLVVGRLVQGRKGHGGGFQLARPPAAIRFADVLRATETDPEPNRCAFGWGECDASRPCPLHGAWSRLDEAFWQWAESTSMADAAATESMLAARRRPAGRRK
jgi:Rrf2 family iron-sulfur cluster assembly transcriptional regulator